ncbi:MAG: TonB-dependent receptor [Verrucomicrobia bacterium]|nr:TonB-dependent receptor [Verrucomicrobiota bacterium]
MHLPTLPPRLAVPATACLALLAPAAGAQSTPAAPGGEVVTMEKFQVRDVPIEKQILPTARPFTSVFGTADNIVDVPRNVTIISRQQLSDISIASVLDFSKLTSSSYTTTNFGAPANPSIRGQTADLFINGVRGRITSNGNGLPLNFNAVESVNIVKGPATAVQGASMYVGGFVDLVTKRPYFDATKGSVSVTLGSDEQREWTVDLGGPLSRTAAYRVSYSGQDSRGYWDSYFNRNHSLYGALTLRPAAGYEIFLSATAARYHYTENWGFNRPTQDLIDKGLYLPGVNSNAAPDFARYPLGYADARGNPITFTNLATIGGPAAPVSDPQNSRWVTSGFPAGNRVVFGTPVKLDRRKRLLKPGDDSNGKEYNVQAIQTLTLSPTFKVVNNSYWSYTNRETLSSYYYSEVIDPSWFAQSRTEFIVTGQSGSLNSGFDLRYQRTKAYDDYFFEPANVWDLTRDPSFIDVYRSATFPNPFTSLPIPGWPGRYATDGITNGDTNDSRGTTVGVFAQGNRRFGEALSLVLGGRLDRFSARVREPLLATRPTASIAVWVPNWNASVVYKTSPTASVYATYNFSRNTSGAVGNGGGITGWNSTGTALFKDNFLQPSELVELGTKYALMQSRVFLNFAVFDQRRTFKSTSSTIIQNFHSKGFEAEMNYQPDKRLYGTLSYSAVDARSSAGFQSDGGVGQFFNSKSTEGRVSGLPRHLFNALVSYTFDSGWGLNANALVTSPINNNFAGTLVIPTQHQIDAGLSYTQKTWSARLTVSNLTNQKNWAPPNAVYGNASILPLPGTQFQLNLKYNF